MNKKTIESKLDEFAMQHAELQDCQMRHRLDFKVYQYLANHTALKKRDRETYSEYYVSKKLEYNRSKQK